VNAVNENQGSAVMCTSVSSRASPGSSPANSEPLARRTRARLAWPRSAKRSSEASRGSVTKPKLPSSRSTVELAWMTPNSRTPRPPSIRVWRIASIPLAASSAAWW